MLTMNLAFYIMAGRCELAVYLILLLILIGRDLDWQGAILGLACLGIVRNVWHYISYPFWTQRKGDDGLLLPAAFWRGLLLWVTGMILIESAAHITALYQTSQGELGYILARLWWTTSVYLDFLARIVARNRAIRQATDEIGRAIGNLRLLVQQRCETLEVFGQRALKEAPWPALNAANFPVSKRLYDRLERLCYK